MGVRKTAVQMTLLLLLATSISLAKGKEDSPLQRRIERFLQESFQPGQGGFGAATGGSPPPGPPQSLTPIPRDSSLAKAVLTGQGPGRKLLSFDAMRPHNGAALGFRTATKDEQQGGLRRQLPRSRILLERLSDIAAADFGATGNPEQARSAHAQALRMLR